MRATPLLLLALAACTGDPTIKDGGTDASHDDPVGGDTDVETPNTAPTAPTVSIAPATPISSDDLVANVVIDATDAEGDALAYLYSWTVDGTPRADLASSTVPASETTRGQTWAVYVRANDGELDGPTGTASVVVENAAPTLTLAWQTILPTTDDDLTVVPTTADADGDPVSLSYAWTLDGVAAAYAGATVPASATVSGQVWRVVVTASDGAGGTAQQELSVTIANRPPAIAGLVVDPNPARPWDALVATFTTSDADGDTVTVGYAWTVNGTPAVGTAGAVVPAVLTHTGETWTVTITADDGHGGISSATASTTVVNHAPELADVLLTPNPAGDSSLLQVGWRATDPDADTLLPVVTWYRNGVALSRTETWVPASLTFPGDTWQATVSVTDRDLSSPTLWSNTVTIVDVPPTAPVVRLDPAVPTGCEPLVCVLATAPVDPDGTPVTTTLRWKANGVAWTGATSSTYRGGDTIPAESQTEGTTFTCEIVASSGGKTTTGSASATVPVAGLHTQVFTMDARDAADVLFMVDDSASMAAEQRHLARDLHAFLDELGRGAVDFHVGVVTSDTSSVLRAGRLVTDPLTGLKWITPTTPNALAVLQGLTQVGTGGSATEQGILATALALTEPLASTANAGFLRTEGALVVVYLSDEDDQSAVGTAASFAAALKGLRADPADVMAFTLAGPVPDGCSGFDGYVEAGVAFDQLVASTGGVEASVCRITYTPALETFAGLIVGLPRRLTLDSPAAAGVSYVDRVRGAVRTRLTAGVDWTFDRASNQVVLLTPPADGDRFEVSFAPTCRSWTPPGGGDSGLPDTGTPPDSGPPWWWDTAQPDTGDTGTWIPDPGDTGFTPPYDTGLYPYPGGTGLPPLDSGVVLPPYDSSPNYP